LTLHKARQVIAQPIKGTRPRGENPADDVSLRLELQSSEKDRAENVMIVDLLRNDLGRVCTYGSVVVDELCDIEQHPTLFHLVSTVRGTLRDDVTISDLIRACFPCGSITGAPKIRAMEIINEVETVPRGLSMGSIGYFGFDGSVDLNVAIRTMTIRDGVARFCVGGGIVADSIPDDEYEESLIKARALFRALGVLEQTGRAK
jgi:anthranilate/para-aminobenzoate synthase component I